MIKNIVMYDEIEDKHTPVPLSKFILEILKYVPKPEKLPDSINLPGNVEVPTGTIVNFLKGHAPKGYLKCDGSEFNQTDFPKLYNLLGVNHVPNLLKRTVGQLAWFPVNNIPNGWLKWDSVRTTVTEAVYPELYALLVAQYRSISNVPLVGDKFIRNYNGSSANIGKLQNSGIPVIQGSFCTRKWVSLTGNHNDRAVNGAKNLFYSQEYAKTVHAHPAKLDVSAGEYSKPDEIWFDLARLEDYPITPRSDKKEVRPSNISFVLCVKADDVTEPWIKTDSSNDDVTIPLPKSSNTDNNALDGTLGNSANIDDNMYIDPDTNPKDNTEVTNDSPAYLCLKQDGAIYDFNSEVCYLNRQDYEKAKCSLQGVRIKKYCTWDFEYNACVFREPKYSSKYKVQVTYVYNGFSGKLLGIEVPKTSSKTSSGSSENGSSGSSHGHDHLTHSDVTATVDLVDLFKRAYNYIADLFAGDDKEKVTIVSNKGKASVYHSDKLGNEHQTNITLKNKENTIKIKVDQKRAVDNKKAKKAKKELHGRLISENSARFKEMEKYLRDHADFWSKGANSRELPLTKNALEHKEVEKEVLENTTTKVTEDTSVVVSQTNPETSVLVNSADDAKEKVAMGSISSNTITVSEESVLHANLDEVKQSALPLTEMYGILDDVEFTKKHPNAKFTIVYEEDTGKVKVVAVEDTENGETKFYSSGSVNLSKNLAFVSGYSTPKVSESENADKIYSPIPGKTSKEIPISYDTKKKVLNDGESPTTVIDSKGIETKTVSKEQLPESLRDKKVVKDNPDSEFILVDEQDTGKSKLIAVSSSNGKNKKVIAEETIEKTPEIESGIPSVKGYADPTKGVKNIIKESNTNVANEVKEANTPEEIQTIKEKVAHKPKRLLVKPSDPGYYALDSYMDSKTTNPTLTAYDILALNLGKSNTYEVVKSPDGAFLLYDSISKKAVELTEDFKNSLDKRGFKPDWKNSVRTVKKNGDSVESSDNNLFDSFDFNPEYEDNQNTEYLSSLTDAVEDIPEDISNESRNNLIDSTTEALNNTLDSVSPASSKNIVDVQENAENIIKESKVSKKEDTYDEFNSKNSGSNEIVLSTSPDKKQNSSSSLATKEISTSGELQSNIMSNKKQDIWEKAIKDSLNAYNYTEIRNYLPGMSREPKSLQPVLKNLHKYIDKEIKKGTNLDNLLFGNDITNPKIQRDNTLIRLSYRRVEKKSNLEVISKILDKKIKSLPDGLFEKEYFQKTKNLVDGYIEAFEKNNISDLDNVTGKLKDTIIIGGADNRYLSDTYGGILNNLIRVFKQSEDYTTLSEDDKAILDEFNEAVNLRGKITGFYEHDSIDTNIDNAIAKVSTKHEEQFRSNDSYIDSHGNIKAEYYKKEANSQYDISNSELAKANNALSTINKYKTQYVKYPESIPTDTLARIIQEQKNAYKTHYNNYMKALVKREEALKKYSILSIQNTLDYSTKTTNVALTPYHTLSYISEQVQLASEHKTAKEKLNSYMNSDTYTKLLDIPTDFNKAVIEDVEDVTKKATEVPSENQDEISDNSNLIPDTSNETFKEITGSSNSVFEDYKNRKIKANPEILKELREVKKNINRDAQQLLNNTSKLFKNTELSEELEDSMNTVLNIPESASEEYITRELQSLKQKLAKLKMLSNKQKDENLINDSIGSHLSQKTPEKTSNAIKLLNEYRKNPQKFMENWKKARKQRGESFDEKEFNDNLGELVAFTENADTLKDSSKAFGVDNGKIRLYSPKEVAAWNSKLESECSLAGGLYKQNQYPTLDSCVIGDTETYSKVYKAELEADKKLQDIQKNYPNDIIIFGQDGASKLIEDLKDTYLELGGTTAVKGTSSGNTSSDTSDNSDNSDDSVTETGDNLDKVANDPKSTAKDIDNAAKEHQDAYVDATSGNHIKFIDGGVNHDIEEGDFDVATAGAGSQSNQS